MHPQVFRSSTTLQRGMVLIVSLIILVIVTLIAVTALRVTILEERMAGNTRDRQLAFEATEYALREAQDVLSAPVLPQFTSTGGSTGGYFSGLNTNPGGVGDIAYWSSTHNWAANSVAANKVAGVLSGQTQPRYVIEEYPAISCDGYSSKWPPPPPRNVYRVTARGTGRTADSVVILQIWYDRGCS
ncbi:MAG: hypothetical protein CVU18_12945 [Betaproteobacteria bacterium HGW-Betaproteobacteria-12]|jgi:type IV pilus assembly protein PilX|nr:MAG: hypothetical protein CVU18_12945 [Betaproteobacteria bacterium HGW-Betaproteobacteria-12]